jgi:hypothetical protein
MPNFIVLNGTSGNNILINIDYIGHIYQSGNKTRIGVVTHNNGGFEVHDTIDDIMGKIDYYKT